MRRNKTPAKCQRRSCQNRRDGWVGFGDGYRGESGNVRIKLRFNGNAGAGATESVLCRVVCMCEAHTQTHTSPTRTPSSTCFTAHQPARPPTRCPFAAILVPRRRARVCRAFRAASRCLFLVEEEGGRARPCCSNRSGWTSWSGSRPTGSPKLRTFLGLFSLLRSFIHSNKDIAGGNEMQR